MRSLVERSGMDDALTRINEELHDPDNAWTAAAFVAAVAGAALGRYLLKHGWTAATGKAPPLNPASEEVTWVASITWGVVTGAMVGVVRALARHGTTSVQRRLS